MKNLKTILTLLILPALSTLSLTASPESASIVNITSIIEFILISAEPMQSSEILIILKSSQKIFSNSKDSRNIIKRYQTQKLTLKLNKLLIIIFL